MVFRSDELCVQTIYQFFDYQYGTGPDIVLGWLEDIKKCLPDEKTVIKTSTEAFHDTLTSISNEEIFLFILKLLLQHY